MYYFIKFNEFTWNRNLTEDTLCSENNKYRNHLSDHEFATNLRTKKSTKPVPRTIDDHGLALGSKIYSPIVIQVSLPRERIVHLRSLATTTDHPQIHVDLWPHGEVTKIPTNSMFLMHFRLHFFFLVFVAQAESSAVFIFHSPARANRRDCPGARRWRSNCPADRTGTWRCRGQFRARTPIVTDGSGWTAMGKKGEKKRV